MIFVCQLFHPDEQSTSQLFSDLLAAKAQNGETIEVLTARPARSEVARTERWQGVLIRRGGWAIDGKRSMIHRLGGYTSYCAWLMWRLVFRTPSSARLLVVTNPPFAPIVVWLCSLFRGWTYDVFLLDVYPDGLVAVGLLKARSLTNAVWRGLNRRTLSRAGRVIVLGRDMADLCRERYGVPADKLHYRPHWSPMPMTHSIPAETTELWRTLGLDGKFVIQYSGNMGLWHDIETIVRAAALTRDIPELHFLMIGGGLRRRGAEELAQSLGLRNFTWLPHQPKSSLSDSLSCCHAALISQRAGLEGVAVPCKIYGILASGRAVLAQVPATSEAARVVQEEACGLCVEPGDTEGLARAIRQLARDRERTRQMGERSFEAYTGKYTLASAVANF